MKNKRKRILKIVGIILLLIGLALTAFGLYSFFSALSAKTSPKYFWCAGLGLPVLGLGFGFTLFSNKKLPPKQAEEDNEK